jgi:putative ABC transport system substrate-binding protein
VKRRELIRLVGGATAWPLTANAQQARGKIVTIGILAIEPWPPIDTFRQALDDLGYIEGKSVRFEYRYTKGRNERFPELANDLVGLNVDAILTWGTDAVLAAKQATATILIVMGAIGDPLGIGIVTNLAHPGANITGFSSRAAELEAKRLQTIESGGPRTVSGRHPLHPHESLYAARAAERAKGRANAAPIARRLRGPRHHNPQCSVRAIDEESAGWPLGAGGHFSGEPARPHRAVRDREQTALRYTFREHVEAGGLIAYTPNYNDLFRRAASYMDKILRGTKPGELLIEQPTKFLLLINLKTARALGLTVPPRLLVLADELIE